MGFYWKGIQFYSLNHSELPNYDNAHCNPINTLITEYPNRKYEFKVSPKEY